MAQLARFFLPPSKVTGGEEDEVKARALVIGKDPQKRKSRASQSSELRYAGHNLRLVRVYLPFTPKDSPSGSLPALPNANAPYIQFALCPGDSASLYRLKQDVFTALTTGLSVLGQLCTSTKPTGSSSFNESFDQRTTSSAAETIARLGNGGFSTPPRGAIGRRRKSFDNSTTVQTQNSTLSPPPPLSLSTDVNPSTPSDVLSRTMSEGSMTKNLRTASDMDRFDIVSALVTAANLCRRLPLPPRHRIRPRNSQISPQKLKKASSVQELKVDEEVEYEEEDDEDDRFDARRESIANTSMKQDMSDYSEELRDLMNLLRLGSGGATTKDTKIPIDSPTPFRFGASYIWWGSSGQGVEVAVEMIRKGVDGFAWRAIESPPSLGLESSLGEGWLLRKPNTTSSPSSPPSSSPPSSLSSPTETGSKLKKRYFNIIRAPSSNQESLKYLFAYFKDASMTKVLNAVQMSHVESVAVSNDPCEFSLVMKPPQSNQTEGGGATPKPTQTHFLRTSKATEAAAWVAALNKARLISCSGNTHQNDTQQHSNKNCTGHIEESGSFEERSVEPKFFEDEIVNLLDIVEQAPAACPMLPKMTDGYYDDFSDDIEKENFLGEEEDDDEDDDDEFDTVVVEAYIPISQL